MKKLSLLFASLIIIMSCSSDSDSTSNNPDFIGKWIIDFEKEYDNNNVHYQTYDYTDGECYGMTTYEFKSNYQFVKDSYDYVGSDCVRNPLRTYNYTYSNNVININNEDEFEIVESTSTTLKLKKVYAGGYYKIIEYSKSN